MVSVPCFVTTAGIDGSGKSTLARELAVRFCLHGAKVRLTFEPGGTQLGRGLRGLLLRTAQEHFQLPPSAHPVPDDMLAPHAFEAPVPLAELLMFAAARAQHVTRIRTWLDQGEIVLCDRFGDCARAYQGARGIRADVIEDIERIATGGLAPDVTILLDLPVEAAQERMRAMGKAKDRFEGEGIDYLNRVRANYLRIARENPKRVVVLDATLPQEELVEQAWVHIVKAMKRLRGNTMRDSNNENTKEKRVVKVFEQALAEGRILLPVDLSTSLKDESGETEVVGITTIRRGLGKAGYLKDPKVIKAWHDERANRLNQAKAENGYPSLQKQRAAGYPNLARARAVKAAMRPKAEGQGAEATEFASAQA